MKHMKPRGGSFEKYATTSDSGEAWWFLGGLAILRTPASAPRTPAFIEMQFPPGGSAPLHAHAELDDTFYVIEGEIVMRHGDQMLVVRAGDMVSLPHGISYSFRVTSEEGAKVLMAHNGDSFLSLVEELGTPAIERRLPREGEFNADPGTVMRLCEKYGTPIMGPQMSEEEARKYLGREAAA